MVFAEELLESDPLLSDSIIEYKFWSFSGITEYCIVCYDTTDYRKKQTDVYSLPDWHLLEGKIIKNNDLIRKAMPKPINLELMMKIVSTLASQFPECRVDLYECKSKVYFGELTFTSGCGRIKNYTPDFLLELGKKLKLPIQD